MAKNFLPECYADGKWVFFSFHGNPYTLHPDTAREIGQMLIDAANNTEGAQEPVSYDEACQKVAEKITNLVAGILSGAE